MLAEHVLLEEMSLAETKPLTRRMFRKCRTEHRHLQGPRALGRGKCISLPALETFCSFIYLFIPYVLSRPCARSWEFQNEYISISVLKKIPVERRRWIKGKTAHSDGLDPPSVLNLRPAVNLAVVYEDKRNIISNLHALLRQIPISEAFRYGRMCAS